MKNKENLKPSTQNPRPLLNILNLHVLEVVAAGFDAILIQFLLL